LAGPAVGEEVGEIAEAGAAVFEARFEDGADGGPDGRDLLRGEGTARPVGGNPGPEQHLVGVDVADAGHNPLVEEQGLDGRPAPGQALTQLPAARQVGEGVRPETGQGRVVEFLRREDRHESEGAGINETDLFVGGADHDVGVGRFNLSRIGYL